MTVVCDGATWTIGQQAHQGTLTGSSQRLRQGPYHVDEVSAYAFGERAFTTDLVRDEPIWTLRLGKVPRWLVLPGPLAVLSWPTYLLWRRYRPPPIDINR